MKNSSSSIDYGGAGEIPLVDEKTKADVFENAIRSIGVVNACEWFGHAPDSEFTRETVKVLRGRSINDPLKWIHGPTNNS